jgi:raffinose/stachyose/melibiose transport system permease protein
MVKGVQVWKRSPHAPPLALSWGHRFQQRATVSAFIFPALLLYAVFLAYPALAAFYYSLTEWDGMSQAKWVGLSNFVRLVQSGLFWNALLHNLVIFAGTMLFNFTVGLRLATLLNKEWRGVRLFRVIFCLPLLLSQVSTAYTWNQFFDPNLGIINQTLRALNLHALAQPWLADPTLALILVILVFSWQQVGVPMLIFLAGLKSIPAELLEAAEVDGASQRQQFWRIVFPLLVPSHTVVLVLTFVNAMRLFDVVFVLGGAFGAPSYGTDVTGLMAYREAFSVMNVSSLPRFGSAAAIGVAMFLIMLVSSILQVRAMAKRGVEL